ncbi:MAG: hypothetical protein ACR5LA_09230 [Wolbachia sp.]
MLSKAKLLRNIVAAFITLCTNIIYQTGMTKKSARITEKECWNEKRQYVSVQDSGKSKSEFTTNGVIPVLDTGIQVTIYEQLLCLYTCKVSVQESGLRNNR